MNHAKIKQYILFIYLLLILLFVRLKVGQLHLVNLKESNKCSVLIFCSFNIYYHADRDPFTFYQRLAVAMTLFFSFLAINALFYGALW